jgi:hypothetical protein
MAELDETAVLKRAKVLAQRDGFTWELDFGVPGAPRTMLRGKRFLSRDRQQEYLERARAELRSRQDQD